MGDKSIIKEAYWLRSISCLAVVLTHAVNTTLANYDHSISQFDEYVLIFIRFMAFFGTPTFVFLSEMLLAHAYPNGVPENFFRKRVKYLLVPFAFMAVVFAAIESKSHSEFLKQVVLNVFLGGYTGYFILIIFQFYLLHVLFHKYLKQWSPARVLSIAFIINASYLIFFNFTEPVQTPVGEYVWQRGYWLFCVGWLFYFVLGYYCGKNYEAFKRKLQEHKTVLTITPLLALCLIVFLVRSDILPEVSSKRVDYIFYTVSVILFIITWTSKLKKTPKTILLISKYSFTIYLIHKVFLYYLPTIAFLSPLGYFLFSAVFCTIGSIAVSKMFSYVPVSKYLIGNLLTIPKEGRVKGTGPSTHYQKGG
ncbi:acyltransferase family protein [Halalkalibacter flavus]|uniref:acyltransferase family protein n=1 Tax=Halalkalibacter flavus TaxID=3090668 RepID=UPI002FC92E2C